MSKIYKVVTPNDLLDTSFDKGVNTPNKIEIKLQYTIANLKTRTDLPNVVFITDNGKEGLFEYDSTDTTSVGDDTLIIVTNSGKRYKKITESLINKSTNVNLGTSDTLYPTQKAVKNYVDTLLTVINNNILFIWKLFSGFSIPELRLLTNSQLALVSSFKCKDFGRVENWYYDSSDSTSADNNGTILVTTSGKRLKAKIDNNKIKATWFGAISDWNGSEATDCTSYIQNAIDYLKSVKGGILEWNGQFLINGTIYINTNNQTPIFIQGVSSPKTDDYNNGSLIYRQVSGDVFRVNLKSDGSCYLTYPNLYNRLKIENIQAIRKPISGVYNTGMVLLRTFRTQS